MIHFFAAAPTTSRTRDLEWVASVFFLSMSAILAWPGDTLSMPQFQAMRVFGVGESFWTWTFALLGAGRMVVLFINGRSPKTPMLRIVGAFIGMVVWTQIGIMVTVGTYQSYKVATFGTALFIPLSIIEFISIVRASLDARYISGR